MIDDTNLKRLEGEILNEKRKLHKEYVKEHKLAFKIMDCLFILIILSNLGALALTNALVFKNEPATQVLEANPVASEVHDYQAHPQAKTFFTGFLFQMGCYGILFLCYISNRASVHTKKGLILNFTLVFFMAFVCLTDLTNNLGYYVGRLLWGV